MMLNCSSRSLSRSGRHLSARSLISMFSSVAPAPKSTEALLERVRMIADPKASILRVLEDWSRYICPISRVQGLKLIKDMKDSRRLRHALQVFEWMDDHIRAPLAEDDVAVRIRLISKVYGVDHAEEYFMKLCPDLKGRNVYGALLSSYVASRSAGKAECLFVEMKRLSFLQYTFPYNMMIALYSQSGNLKMIETMLSVMQNEGIRCKPNTLAYHMSGCVNASNTDGMAKILNQIRTDPSLANWRVYTFAARGYLNMNMKESALKVLKQAEHKLPNYGWFVPIRHVMYLYAGAGSKEDVYRIWEKRFRNRTRNDAIYSIMISSLLVLDDFEGAERVFWEWHERQSRDAPYNSGVLKSLVSGYCEKHLPDAAKMVLCKMSRTHSMGLWKLLACGYIDVNEIGKGVEIMKKAMAREGWWPPDWILRKCLGYLEKEGNVEEMEEFFRCMEKAHPLNDEIYGYLLRTRIAASRTVAGVVAKMKKDGIEMSGETRKIIYGHVHRKF